MKTTSPIHRPYIPRSLYDAARRAGANRGLSPARYIVLALKYYLFTDNELPLRDPDLESFKLGYRTGYRNGNPQAQTDQEATDG